MRNNYAAHLFTELFVSLKNQEFLSFFSWFNFTQIIFQCQCFLIFFNRFAQIFNVVEREGSLQQRIEITKNKTYFTLAAFNSDTFLN